MNPAMSWHGTKGFPGGREIKLDPELKPSAAIYASLNLLSSYSRPHPVEDDFRTTTATTVTTPPFRCSSPHKPLLGTIVPNLRLQVSPASCYQGDYFFIFYAPPTATSLSLSLSSSCSPISRQLGLPLWREVKSPSPLPGNTS